MPIYRRMLGLDVGLVLGLGVGLGLMPGLGIGLGRGRGFLVVGCRSIGRAWSDIWVWGWGLGLGSGYLDAN